jgi:hypothetical protein
LIWFTGFGSELVQSGFGFFCYKIKKLGFCFVLLIKAGTGKNALHCSMLASREFLHSSSHTFCNKEFLQFFSSVIFYLLAEVGTVPSTSFLHIIKGTVCPGKIGLRVVPLNRPSLRLTSYPGPTHPVMSLSNLICPDGTFNVEVKAEAEHFNVFLKLFWTHIKSRNWGLMHFHYLYLTEIHVPLFFQI